ncbi:MAG: hypothetical protein ACJ8AW_25355 [Rhodopila sp.]
MAVQPTYDGIMAARVDRLPLTRVQWQLAVLVEVTWGFIVFDTDGIGARLYPFVWRPNHIIDVVQYAVIQALLVGLGVLLGVTIMRWVADRYGRRPAILLATFLGGVNARLGEQVERRAVSFVMGLLFAASRTAAWLVPNLWIIALCTIASRIGTGLFLFNLYNYTAIAYPTRIRSKAFAWWGTWAPGPPE